MKKRFEVYKYPSHHGTPKEFNYKIIAYIYMIIINLSLKYGEITLYDNHKLKYITKW